MDKTIQVLKANGELVPFESEKLRESLERSGASIELINEVLEGINDVLVTGMSTKAIYKKAFSLLRKRSSRSAARYKLKRAIAELGPTGYPFEQFVGELLKNQGYDLQVGVEVQGRCVSHEVDVIAIKDNEHFMIECKFHSDANRKCGVQVPLYIRSRFVDIKKQWENNHEHKDHFHQGWVVTNTKFSEDALQYGTCVGLHLVSWNFPKSGSLKERIELSGLHPITCLTTLNNSEKQRLLELSVVLCKTIIENPQLLFDARLERRKHTKVLNEIEQVLG